MIKEFKMNNLGSIFSNGWVSKLLNLTPLGDIEIPIVTIESARYDVHAGYGATNTVIPYYTNERKNTLSTLGVIDNDAALGWSFTATKKCAVSLSVNHSSTASNVYLGISLDSTQLTTGVASITQADRVALSVMGNVTNWAKTVSVEIELEIGETLRPHMTSGFWDTSQHNLTMVATGIENKKLKDLI